MTCTLRASSGVRTSDSAIIRSGLALSLSLEQAGKGGRGASSGQRASGPAGQARHCKPCLFWIGDSWMLLNPAGLIRHDRGVSTNSSLRAGQDASKRVRCGGAMQVPDPNLRWVVVEQPRFRQLLVKQAPSPPRRTSVMTDHCSAYQIWSRSGPLVRLARWGSEGGGGRRAARSPGRDYSRAQVRARHRRGEPLMELLGD
jgi:hypothetical protein